MSEVTFNIADYRRAHPMHSGSPVVKRPGSFVVLTSNPRPGEHEERWMEAAPRVVDIRSIRETPHRAQLSCHRGSYLRRGKILSFTSEEPERVITMPPQNSAAASDDDPDPTNFPSAA